MLTLDWVDLAGQRRSLLITVTTDIDTRWGSEGPVTVMRLYLLQTTTLACWSLLEPSLTHDIYTCDLLSQ